MSRKKNRKKNFVKQIAVVNKTPVKQEEQMVSAVAQDVHLVNVTILSFFPSNDKRKSYFDYSYSAH